MYEALLIAATGLRNQQARMDTVANNVANVNSAAYKSARLDFKDALYTAQYNPSYPRTPEGNQQKGHGLMVAGITKDYSTGAFQLTERNLDVAIEGEGFFELEDPNGNLVYSRNGSFQFGQSEDGMYLVNGSGWYVHDADGERIQIPENAISISFGVEGTIRFTIAAPKGEEGEEAAPAPAEGEEGEGTEEVTATLGLFTFKNLTGLLSVGSGNYGESDASGEKVPAEGVVLRQGVLEMSNVKLAEEMTRLIRTQRAFQLSSRALTTADQMEGIANDLKRR